MPHVDDGVLHAWLDGAIDALDTAGELPAEMTKADVIAHLSTCPDCRARLDAEREIRERAGLVLHDVSLPSVEVPPFGVLTTRSRRAPRRALPLSWAASVLIAVGAGWWGNAQWRSQMPPSTTGREEAVVTAPTDATGSIEQSAAPAAPAAQSAAADQQPNAPVANPRDAEETLAARRETAVATPASPDVGRATRDASPPPASPDAMRAAPDASPPPAEAAQPQRSLAAADTTILGEPIGATARTGLDRTAEDLTVAASDARRELQRPQSPASAALRLSDTSTAVYLVPNAEMRAFQSVLLRARTGQLSWSAVTPQQNADVADQLYVIDGASEPRIERASDRESSSVRITQTLESGAPVELLVWRQEAVAMSEVAVAPAHADSQQDRVRASRARQTPAAAAEAAMNKATSAATRAALVTTGASQILPDGRRELMLRSSERPVWIALRADLTDSQLRDLAGRIVVLDEHR